MRRGWLVACLILLGVFGTALFVSLDYSLSDSLGPGAGFFPFWLSVIGGALTVAIMVQVSRSPAPAGADLVAGSDRAAVMRSIALLVALGITAAALEPLGYRLTMLLFIPGVLLRARRALSDRHRALRARRQLRRVPRLLLLAQGAAADRRVRDMR